MSNLLAMLGLARRAGALNHGFDAVTRTIESGRTDLVIVAGDASPRTRSEMVSVCQKADVCAVIASNKYDIGRAIGYENVAVVAVTDRSFADGIRKALSGVQVEKGRDLIDKNASV